MNRLLPFALPALLAPALLLAAGPEQPLTEASGAELYGRFCVSCHGTLGTGDGPVAATMRVKPADLTRIGERAGGVFPEARVRETIDGRAVLPAHGTREMPVWGYELEARAPADAPGRAAAQAMTDRLVAYVRSIQR